MVSPAPPGALEVLERMRQAAITRSALDMSSVYAVGAVHEFPFARPGVPARLEGRDAIMSFITAFWKTSPLTYERYRTIAIHATANPDTIIVEQEVAGTSSTTGSFVLPNIMVLKTRHGEIAHLRDYANLIAVEEATGGPLVADIQLGVYEQRVGTARWTGPAPQPLSASGPAGGRGRRADRFPGGRLRAFGHRRAEMNRPAAGPGLPNGLPPA
jgi:uncharacterized protein